MKHSLGLLAFIGLAGCASDSTPVAATADMASVPLPTVAGSRTGASVPIPERVYLRATVRHRAPLGYRDTLLAHGASFVSRFNGRRPLLVSASRDVLRGLRALPWLEIAAVDSGPPPRLNFSIVAMGS